MTALAGWTPTASVAMPCHDAADTLPAQLERLLPQIEQAGAELVLLDNNSTDATPKIIADAADSSPNIVAASDHEGRGVAYARNAAVAHCRGPRLLFCDADDLVGDDWVESMIGALESSDIVTGSLEIDSLNSETMAASRGQGATPSFYGFYTVAAGGNLGMRRAAWDRIGPLDADLPSLEDQDWSLRAWLAGLEVTHVPRAVIHYRYRTTASELWHQGWIYGRSRPPIGRRLFEATGRRPPRIAGLRSWVWLLVHALDLVRRERRSRWVWVAGNRLGQLRGCIDARFLLL